MGEILLGIEGPGRIGRVCGYPGGGVGGVDVVCPGPAFGNGRFHGRRAREVFRRDFICS